MKQFCIVCNDKNHFKNEVYNTRNINNYILSKINHLKFDRKFKLDKDEQIFYSKIRFEHKNIHFKCGNCLMVNQNELNIIENELKQNITFLIRAVNTIEDKNKRNSFIYDVSRVLQGHYPKMCSELRKYINKKEV